MIQQNEVVEILLDLIYRVLSRGTKLRGDSEEPEEILSHLEIHLIVIHHQHLCAGRRKGIRFLLPAAVFQLLCIISNGRGIRYALAEREEKYGALAILTLYLYLAFHHLKEVGNNGHAEARPFYAAVLHLVEAFKGFKEPRQVLLPDTNSGILHRHVKPGLISLCAPQLDGQPHKALPGVLHGVCQNIHDHLGQPYIIPDHLAGEVFVYVCIKFQTLFPGPFRDRYHQIVDHGGRIIGDRNYLHLSLFNFGKVQDAVYQGKQGPPGVVYIGRVFEDLLVLRLP